MVTRRTYSGRHTAARVIAGVGGLFAFILLVYILLLLFGANTGNGFFQFVQSIAVPLSLFFPGLFSVSNHVVEVLLDYGVPAVFWLVVTGFIARLLN